MKTLRSAEISVEGDTITIKAKIVDQPFQGILITRVTHGHLNHENMRHPRRIQSSSEAVFVEAPMAKIAIPNKLVSRIAAAMEPMTSFPPKIKRESKPNEILVCSEIPVTYQWQISNNPKPIADKPHTPPPPAIWNDISGETSNIIDESKVEVGKWIRCVVKNAAGTLITVPTLRK